MPEFGAINSTTNIQTNGSRTLRIFNPTHGEDITMFFTFSAITVREMRGIIIGTNFQLLTWTIRHNPAIGGRDQTGNEVVTGGTTTIDTTSGSDVTSFDDPTIPANSFVWLETTARGGDIDEFAVTVDFDED